MPTTEIAIIPLTEGTRIGDPSNAGATVMSETATTLHQQPGFHSLHFGTQVETPSTLQMLITWDSRQSHEDFQASPAYQPFLQKFVSIMSGPADIHHVDFQSQEGLKKALAAPMTELATFYCDGKPGDEWLGNAAKAAEWLGREASGAGGYVAGASAFGITHEEVEYKGVKGKAAVIAIGWTSKEAHMSFRETQTFKENIGLLRGDAKAIEMHHVVMMQALE
jgi:quinol monooxygenase YgiN